jgi:hypothetical protein
MHTPAFNKIDQILVPHTSFLMAKTRLEQHFEASRTSEEPIGLAIVGESRSGKSRVLDHVTRQNPKVRKEGGLEVPILSITTPSKPTVKGLVEELLHAIGDPLWNRRASEIEKTERLIVLLTKANTTMITIDEFQHFYDKTSHKVQHHLADWLKTLIDRARIALVVAGLPTCMAVISQNEQLSGRFMGAIHMPRFDWVMENDRLEFMAIMDAFQEMLPDYDLPPLDSEAMAFRFYCATGGLIGYIAKILRQAIWDASFEERKIITLEHLASAFDKSVWKKASSDMVNPFTDDFNAMPTKHIIAMAKSIGVAEDDLPARPIPKRKPSVAEALSR